MLACFRNGETTLGNLELAQRCGLPKSTVSRLTHTLARQGYLIQLPDSGRFRLGTACLALGSAMLSKLDLRQVARPLMQELALASRATVSLGVRDRLSMIYVENCRGSAALTLTLDVGSRIPLATSAIGRAWLAVSTPAERAAAMAELRDADRKNWPALRRGIEQAVSDHAELGVTRSFGEWQPEVNGIARGFQPGNGLPAMAINIGGAAFQLSPEHLMQELRPRLIEVVARLEEAMPR